MAESIKIYTDGACRGNPGPGGWGALIIENGEETNPNIPDIHGRTPMDLAARNGYKSVCQLFQEDMSFFQIFRSNLRCNIYNLRLAIVGSAVLKPV